MKKRIFLGLIVLVSTTLILGLANAKGNVGHKTPTNTTTNSTVFIHNINEANGQLLLTSDEIQWYEDEEANLQFREHEEDANEQEALDGYYIVNDNSELQSLRISPNAEVIMQIYDQPGVTAEPELNPDEAVSLKQFKALFNQMDRLDLRDYPFHLTIKNGEVIKIVQQFIP
ncbi:hypothetical protein EHS13_28995 [Paenibacillus psychroresistens]|uniref:Uncharacterized protein n=1 Tax=Paenibacillus psychroresistens TaxID=1778678 RepID=A0A6B8RQH0_9BACL|nr:hypothetical protein [Paenibacillus psychroresistens]QGQ98631.1 hypothetical protein EHS13_28995 [Paenibacillus psychroresistens]